MNHDPAPRRRAATLTNTANMLSVLSLVLAIGCDAWKCNVILAADARDYRPTMTWTEIRENGFEKPFIMRIADTDGKAIPLYKFKHESRSLSLLEETEIHISTPIIIEKKYETFSLSVLDGSNEVSKVRVVIRDLKRVKGGPEAYVLPLALPDAKGRTLFRKQPLGNQP